LPVAELNLTPLDQFDRSLAFSSAFKQESTIWNLLELKHAVKPWAGWLYGFHQEEEEEESTDHIDHDGTCQRHSWRQSNPTAVLKNPTRALKNPQEQTDKTTTVLNFYG